MKIGQTHNEISAVATADGWKEKYHFLSKLFINLLNSISLLGMLNAKRKKFILLFWENIREGDVL